MPAIELRQYLDVRGHSPFERWYQELDENTRARVAVTLARLAGGSVNVKSAGAGVMELRLDFGPGYRIYLGRDGENLILLLGGGSKKRQRADIQAAQRRWRDYKQSKREDVNATDEEF